MKRLSANLVRIQPSGKSGIRYVSYANFKEKNAHEK